MMLIIWTPITKFLNDKVLKSSPMSDLESMNSG